MKKFGGISQRKIQRVFRYGIKRFKGNCLLGEL